MLKCNTSNQKINIIAFIVDNNNKKVFFKWHFFTKLIEQEEPYVSRVSFLDKNKMPVYKSEQLYKDKFNSSRV